RVAAGLARTSELCEHRFRIRLEPLLQPEALQGLLAERAELARREHAPGERSVDVLWLGADDADRGGTGDAEQQHAERQAEAAIPQRLLTRHFSADPAAWFTRECR